MAYDFTEAFGEKFGGLTNGLAGIAGLVGEYKLNEIKAKDAASASVGVSQLPASVDTDGAPNGQGVGVLGLSTTSLVLGGVGLLLGVGGLVYLKS